MNERIPAALLPLDQFLTTLFHEGRLIVGQIVVRDDWSLRHLDDQGTPEEALQRYQQPAAAREIARYDAAGNFRPLKTAPNLRSGWLLQLADATSVRLALDFFYPAAVGLYRSALEGRLRVTSLRETLGRQTGMYRVTQKITDEAAREVILQTCASESGCLRRVLWPIENEGAHVFSGSKASLDCRPGELPLICRELCNLAVAACRQKVKQASG